MITSEALPPRLQSILEKIAAGDGPAKISEDTGLSLATVRAYRRELYLALNVKSAGAAVRVGFERGYLTPRKEK